MILLTGAFVPSGHHEARVVDIVIEVVVGEEQVVDVQWVQANLRHLVGSGRSTVEHDLLPAHIDNV